MAQQTSVVELTAMQQLVEDIRKGNDISFLNDEHIGHYLAIERKQQELISAQRYIDGFSRAKEAFKNKKYTLQDMSNCWYASLADAMQINEEDYKPLFFNDYIKSI